MLPLIDPSSEESVHIVNCKENNTENIKMQEIDPMTEDHAPSLWSIFTEQPTYPTHSDNGFNIRPMAHIVPHYELPLDEAESTDTPSSENPLHQPFDSINAKITAASTYDETTDVSTTYIGPLRNDMKSTYQFELEYNFDAQLFTTGILPDGKEFRILIDTGATRSYLSKSFFDSNPYLHKFPQIKPRATRIYMGNGEWVPVLFIIPLCFSVDKHAFEIYTIVCPMANSDFIWGMRNIVETEGQLCTRTMKYKFLNRSPQLFPSKPLTLLADGTEQLVEMKVDFPSEISGHAIAKLLLSPDYLLRTVKVPVKCNRITLGISNHSGKKIEITPDAPIGILDVRSVGYFHIGLDHLKRDHLKGYKFKTLHEIEYQMNKMIDFVNDQNKPKRPRNHSDPYPWLDPSDPRRHLTDEEILDKTVNLKDSCLNSKEKKYIMCLIKRYKKAFSL